MSLVDQTLPARETEPGKQAQEQKMNYRDSLPGAPKPICTRQSYDGAIFEDLYHDDMMSPATKNTEQADQPPALPEKSALRASRLLNGFDMKLSAQPVVLAQTTPHDVYLSSEEDASSSADDFSDYDYESENEEYSNGRRRSHEDTARVVSVIFSGRPSIVDVCAVRQSISPNSVEARRQSSLGSLTESASSSSSRRMSTSSTAASSITHPPRSTSMGTDLVRNKPLFLSIDPFAQRPNTESIDEHEPLKTPKTPTAMFKKTLSLVRKRSRPVLNTFSNGSQTTLASPSVHNLSGDHLEDVHEEPRHQEQQASLAQTQTPTKPATPVTYNDIIKAAKKNTHSAPPTPLSPVPGSPIPNERKSSRILSGLGMGRRRSIKVTGF